MRTAKLDDERGIALAVSLFCLVVVGAIVAGNFFAARLEQQSGQNMFFVAEASEAAEAGVSDALATLSSAAFESLPVGGEPLLLSPISLGPGVSSAPDISRLTATLFLIRARGTRANAAGDALASRGVGALVQVAGATSSEPARLLVIERGWFQLY
ncbi:MAG TPA: hypothetical protein VKA25_04650 [Gemmatimonadales bacterium]|nr:hypothetical protein [Gemmatimonadales bacterium]